MKKISDLPETKLQQVVHYLLSEPSQVRKTENGKRLQILSPGRLNVHEGPDFIEIAILLNGQVIIGDAEFHKNSSDWDAHSHSSDPRYDSVILHIVHNNNKAIENKSFNILKISEEELITGFGKMNDQKSETADISSIEELQHYALLRLLRKTSDAQKSINEKGLQTALKFLTEDYINKYLSRRKRPVYTTDNLHLIIDSIDDSLAFVFLKSLSEKESVHIPDIMQQLMKQKIHEEGSHFRRELILNCILPVALCLAND